MFIYRYIYLQNIQEVGKSIIVLNLLQNFKILNIDNNINTGSDNKILLPKCHTTDFGLKSFAN